VLIHSQSFDHVSWESHIDYTKYVCVMFSVSLTVWLCVCRIDRSEAIYVVQTVLPDIVAFVASLVTCICCRVLPLHRVIPSGGIPDVDGIAHNHHGSVASGGRHTASVLTQCKAVGVLLTLVIMAACGIIQPSLLNSLYFIATMVVATVWALRIGGQVGKDSLTTSY